MAGSWVKAGSMAGVAVRANAAGSSYFYATSTGSMKVITTIHSTIYDLRCVCPSKKEMRLSKIQKNNAQRLGFHGAD
jgi:hypothetical protein